MKNKHIAVELIKELSERFQFSDENTLKFMVAGILAELKILLKGGTGTGKSTISKAIAEFFGNAACDLTADSEGNLVEGGNSYRVQGTIGTQSSSFLGGLDIAQMTQGIRKVVFRKFLTFPIKFIDEAGRFNPYVWADLAQVLAEQEVTIEGVTMKLPRPGVFLFTMNPPNPRDPANIDLPPFAYSRIDMKLSLPAPSVSGNRKIIKRQGVNHNPMPRNYTPEDLTSIWDEVKTIGLDLSAEISLAAMVRATSYCEKGGLGCDKNQVIESGSFPSVCANCDHSKGSMVCSQSTPLDSRVIDSCIGLAQALCYIDGRDIVTEKDILAAMPSVAEHRLFFPNTQVVNRETHTKEFVNKMYGAASTCIEIARNPAKITKKRLEEIRSQKSPLVNEILDDFEAEIKEAGKAIRSKLASMTASELKVAKESLESADAKLVDQMIALRHSVTFKVNNMDDPFNRAMMCSPEGEPFISDDDSWDDLIADGMATRTMEGVRITCEIGGFFSVAFCLPEEADIFRHKIEMDVDLQDPYGPIRNELTKAGIVSKTVSTPTHQPQVTAFTADQGKLF